MKKVRLRKGDTLVYLKENDFPKHPSIFRTRWYVNRRAFNCAIGRLRKNGWHVETDSETFLVEAKKRI